MLQSLLKPIKPTYIAIAVLVALLGLQTWRLSGAHLDLAKAETAQATLQADIAIQREAGVREGVQRQKAAQSVLDEIHRQIVTGLEKDKADLQKHYDQTYGILRDLAGQENWGCLKEPLPEPVLKEFRR